MNHLHPGTHPAATLLNSMRIEGVAVNLNVEQTAERLQEKFDFGCHSSATSNAAFFRAKLAEQVREGITL